MVHNLKVAEMVLAVLLSGVILLQQRGTSLGGAFGGESSVYRSLRGIERVLFFATILIAVLFGGLALLLLWFASV